MSYFKVCPSCDAHLDPQEQCDCDSKAVKAARDKHGAKYSRNDDYCDRVSTKKRVGKYDSDNVMHSAAG